MTNIAQSGTPPKAPDGGWGWAVVLAAFLSQFLADGFVYSFGVFLPDFVNVFGASHALAGSIGGILPAVTLGSGPLVSALVNMYGCRIVAISGAFIAVTALIITTFATSIYYIMVTMGLLLGIGFGCIYVPAIVSVSYYFENKRAFATGLAVCGSGFGTFALAPLTEYLIEEYTWRGAILIHAGLVLHVVAFGLIMRPLPIEKSEQLKSARKAKKARLINRAKRQEEQEEENRLLSKGEIIIDPENGLAMSLSPPRLIENSSNPSFEDSPAETVDGNSDDPTVPSIERGAMYRKDVLYTGNLQNLPLYEKSKEKYYSSVTSIPRAGGTCLGIPLSGEVRNTFHEIMDLSILQDPVFLLFAVSNLFTSVGFNVPFIYMKDQGLDLGLDDDKAAFLISGIGIGNTVGRIVFGLVANMPNINKLYMYITGLALCGLFVFLDPFFTTFEPLLFCAIMFGFFVGAYITLTSVLLVDLMGLERLTNAFGLLMLFQGTATLAGAPLCGLIKDTTGSYSIPFWSVGVAISFSGMMLFLIPCMSRRFIKKIHDEANAVSQMNHSESSS